MSRATQHPHKLVVATPGLGQGVTAFPVTIFLEKTSNSNVFLLIAILEIDALREKSPGKTSSGSRGWLVRRSDAQGGFT
jgi:hypothetical protein